MSENNNEIVLNEENNLMNAYEKIPFMPFPTKQKEYVSNYNKNRYSVGFIRFNNFFFKFADVQN